MPWAGGGHFLKLGVLLLIKRLTTLTLAAATLIFGQVANHQTAWPHYREISIETAAGLAKLNLDAEVLAVAGNDGADMRLYDAAGVEIPYALRVLRDIATAEQRVASEHARSTEGRNATLTLDLGPDPAQYNQVEILTEGQNYRRRVVLFGSDDGVAWSLIGSEAVIFSFEAPTGQVVVNRVRYADAQFQYLRIEVSPHDQAETKAPVIDSVKVQMAIQKSGEEASLPLEFLGPNVIETPARIVSVYRLELPGRIPIQSLSFTMPSAVFSREFQVESLEAGNVVPQTVAGGRLVSRGTAASNDTKMRFREVFSRELRLTIADDGEPPLKLEAPVVAGAVRQLVFDTELASGGLVRLYYGNPAAEAPQYDFPQTLLASIDEEAAPLVLGAATLNPNYDPPARPLRETAPWLAYVALAGACLALTAILYSLIWNVGGDAEASSYAD